MFNKKPTQYDAAAPHPTDVERSFVVVGGGFTYGHARMWGRGLTALRLMWARPRYKIATLVVGVLLLFSGVGFALFNMADKPASPKIIQPELPGGAKASEAVAEPSGTPAPANTPASNGVTPATGDSSAKKPTDNGGGGGNGGGSGGGDSGGGGDTPAAQACPAYPAFPDAGCTGVPPGTSLSVYTGPCTITTNNYVIDSKTVNCALSIQATGVTIKNSQINGNIATPDGSLAYSFTLTDSEVIAPQATESVGTVVGEANFTLLRVEITGGNRSVYCRKNCTVRDSYVHGQKIPQSPRIHASGIRQSQGSTIIHNRILCDAPDTSSGGGCSANLTGYGDFEPVKDNRIEKNLFVATPAGACAYGGSSGDDGSKPYGDQASNIVFIDNVFQRGSGGNCGFYFPITDFDSGRPGNLWTNNMWDDGTSLPPAN